MPPVGLAVVCGGLAVALAGRATPAPVAWNPPALVVPELQFSAAAFVAISLPMVVLAVGLGNVQGLGFLLGQGYHVPVNVVTVLVGANSVVNALLGGHSAIVARTGVSILASPDAGSPAGRYWANIVAAFLTVLIALAALPVASLLGILPPGYIVALAGLGDPLVVPGSAGQGVRGRLALRGGRGAYRGCHTVRLLRHHVRFLGAPRGAAGVARCRTRRSSCSLAAGRADRGLADCS